MAAPHKLTKEQRQARDVRIWDLRCTGWTQAQIAREMGLSAQSVSVVLNHQREAFREAHQDEVAQVLTDEAAAIEAAIKLWDARAQVDGRGAFRAGELALRYRERKARLLGLDRPAKVEVSGTVITPIDVEIAELYAQLGISDPTLAPQDAS